MHFDLPSVNLDLFDKFIKKESIKMVKFPLALRLFLAKN